MGGLVLLSIKWVTIPMIKLPCNQRSKVYIRSTDDADGERPGHRQWPQAARKLQESLEADGGNKERLLKLTERTGKYIVN